MSNSNPYQAPAPNDDFEASSPGELTTPASVKFLLQAEEMRNAIMDILGTSEAHKGVLNRNRRKLISIALLLSLITVVTALSGDSSAAVICGFLSIGGFWLAGALHRIAKKGTRDYLDAEIEKDPNLLTLRHTCTLREDGFVIENEAGTELRRWSFVKRVKVRGELLLIYLTMSQLMPIPSRAFLDEAAFQAFADLARRLWEENQRPEGAAVVQSIQA